MTYTQGMPGRMEVPADLSFTASLPVPAIWDDYAGNFDGFDVVRNPLHCEIDFQAIGDHPPDSSLPFIVGTVWLRRRVPLSGRHAYLEVGGCRLEAWCWLNGRYVGHHFGHSTEFEFNLPQAEVPKDGLQEIILAVSNLRQDRTGCDLRGFAGRSGGILRGIKLHNVKKARVRDLYLLCNETLKTLEWKVELEGDLKALSLQWEIREDEKTLLNGRQNRCEAEMSWDVSCKDLPQWSDESPNLLEAHLTLFTADGCEADHRVQPFGVRRLLPEGKSLRLNGSPIFLRGATEHCYFPESTVPHTSLDQYRQMVGQFKQLGFNWLRFHTWVPPKEYLLAADEAGMLVQVEPPVGSGKHEWEAIVRAVRTHPSVVIICAGNEECLDEQKITLLESFAALIKREAPDLLFNPQEGMRGVEYCWQDEDFGTPVTRLPFVHNPARLAWLHEFSDLFGHYSWGHFSYKTLHGDWRKVSQNLAVYQKPCLSHELCIHGSFLDFSLAKRHQGTREGTRIYDPAWKEVERIGFQSRTDELHRASCSWMQLLRKYCVEIARRCDGLAGYDLLGAVDYHWHRHGYPCGVMNEFFEMKPGETQEDVRRYNNASVLLLELGPHRNYRAGGKLNVALSVSLFTDEETKEGTVSWKMLDRRGCRVAQGTKAVFGLENGRINELGTLATRLPEGKSPDELTIHVALQIGEKRISNQWSIWVFPMPAAWEPTGMRILWDLDEEALKYLDEGGTAMLMLTEGGPLPTSDLSFQISMAGRANGNLALLVHPHPIWDHFPHDGFCNWQFYPMIEGGVALRMGENHDLFQPILEVISSFKRLELQGALLEWNVGKGRLLICGLKMPQEDPGAAWLHARLIHYLNGTQSTPGPVISIARLREIIANRSLSTKRSLETDMGFDALGQLPALRTGQP